MSRFFICALTFFALFFSTLFGTAHGETVDRIVAVVNDEPITLYQLDKVMSENLEDIKRLMGLDKRKKFNDVRTVALQKLIEDKLLEQEIGKRSIVVSEDDVQKAIKNVLERNKLTEEQLKHELVEKGSDFAAYKEQLKEQLKRIKFMGQVIAPRIKVTDADLDDFFADNPEQFSKFQSVDMAQIILPLGVDADDKAIQESQKLADTIVQKAKGGANFEELGKKYSANPQTAVREIYPASQLAPQILDVLADLKPGEVGAPVRSGMGLHIIKLYDRKTMAGEDYKAIREQIRGKIFEMKVEEEMLDYVDELREKSYIEIRT